MSPLTIPSEHLLTLSRCVIRAAKTHTELAPPTGLNKAQTYGLLKVVALLKGTRQPDGVFRFEETSPAEVRRRIETTLLTGSTHEGYPSSDFGTPLDTAEHLLSVARVAPGMTVLEPSAGRGHLTTALRHFGATVLAIEVEKDRANELAEKAHYSLVSRPPRQGVTPGELLGVLQFDFLAAHPTDLDVYSPDGFDAVVMVPPFDGLGVQYAYMRHVLHALPMLKPRGVLVACLPAGCSYQCDAPTVEFRGRLREAVKDVTFHTLPPNLSPGTSVPMVVLAARIGVDRIPVAEERAFP